MLLVAVVAVVAVEGLVAFPWIIGLPELESENDVAIVAFCAVFVVLTKIPVETCKVEIFVSAFVKSATLTQSEPFQPIMFY